METKDIRSETVLITEQAAWALIQKLQRTAFEKEGLPGVLQLNKFLSQSYEALTIQGQKWGKSPLQTRRTSAGLLITDLLPKIEQRFASETASFATPDFYDGLASHRDRLLKSIESY